MEEFPFAPTSLTAVLADLVFVLLLAGGPIALRWLQTTQAALRSYYDTHTSAGERAVLAGVARDAVAWAEHFARSPEGRAKFQQAVEMVQEALQRRGICLDLTEIEAAIQAAWSDMPKAAKEVAAAGPEAEQA